MGVTVATFKATHQAAAGLLGEIESASGQQRVDKANATASFKSSGQSFMDDLGNVAQTALLPFFDKYSSVSAANSDDFSKDFGGIKSALVGRIAFEEGKFYPELEKLGY